MNQTHLKKISVIISPYSLIEKKVILKTTTHRHHHLQGRQTLHVHKPI